MNNKKYYLYHLRDPETSAGFGFDSYVGMSNDLQRRYAEHMKACAAGRHPNHKVQELYDKSNGKLQMHIVREATKEEVLASEALVVNRANKHANIQRGGGHLRGLSQEELIRRAGLGSRHDAPPAWRPVSSSLSQQQKVLIAATSIVLAAAFFYGFKYYKKRKHLKNSGAGAPALAAPQGKPSGGNATGPTSLAVRRARLDEMKKRMAAETPSMFMTLATYTVLALAGGAIQRQ